MASFASSIADRKTPAERKKFIETATKLKNEGNEWYRKMMEECKKPEDQRDKSVLNETQKNAKRQYHHARLQAQAAYPFQPNEIKAKIHQASTSSLIENELRADWTELIASIFNNLAAVILAHPEQQKQEDYERAAEYCSNVLVLQNDNAKAMYRKAQALERMGHPRRALTYYRDADLAENHQNAAIQRDLVRLTTKVDESLKQSKDQLKENFQRGIASGGLGLSSDAVVYGKRDKKKKQKTEKQRGHDDDPDSPSRGSSATGSTSSADDSDSSSSGRSSN